MPWAYREVIPALKGLDLPVQWRKHEHSCCHPQVDLLRATEARALQDYMAEQAGVVTVLPTSAIMGRGVEAVRDWAVAQLPEGPTLYPKVHCGGKPTVYIVAWLPS